MEKFPAAPAPIEQAAQLQVERPTAAELAAAVEQINSNRTSGVYTSKPNTVGGQPELRLVKREEAAARIGSIATGEAVGMAALPEAYAAQQLNQFNFTAAEYGAWRAQEEQVRRSISQPISNTESSQRGSTDNRNNNKRKKRRYFRHASGREESTQGELLLGHKPL